MASFSNQMAGSDPVDVIVLGERLGFEVLASPKHVQSRVVVIASERLHTYDVASPTPTICDPVIAIDCKVISRSSQKMQFASAVTERAHPRSPNGD